MRSRRLMLAVTAVLAVTSLAACSGSDDPKSDDSPSASGAPSSGAAEEPYERTCDVEVAVAGSVTASWQGDGRASNEAGPTMYHSEDGKNRITVYAGKDDVPTTATLTVDGANYTTTSDQGLDVAGNGTKATVDADTTGVDGPGPHVTATFTCGKDGGKGKGKGKS